MIRITHISDTHATHGRLAASLPGGDLLLHTGDFSNIGERDEVEEFVEWLSWQPYQHKVFIAGNHDTSLQSERLHMVKWDWHRNNVHYRDSEHNALPDARPAWAEALIAALPPGVTYLQDSGAEIGGLRIWGSPASPAFGRGWAFNYDTFGIARVWDCIPKGTDILLTHTPPFGYGDLTWQNSRAGCETLLERIRGIGPAMHACGHIHEGHGQRIIGGPRETVTVNSALMGYERDMPPHHMEMRLVDGVYRVSLCSTD